MSLRYEDVGQDGRAKLDVLAAALGEACWRHMLARHPLPRVLHADGVIPILRRLIMVGTDLSLSVHSTVAAEGRLRLALGGERHLLDLDARVTAPRGSTHDVRAGVAEHEAVGHVFAEHVLTRPFAEPERRRVHAWPEGYSHQEQRAWTELDELSNLGDAKAIDRTAMQARELTFAMRDTDSNRHVNSLVYPRLFEEASTQQWQTPELAMRAIHIAWRKPCFVGDRVRIEIQRIAHGDAKGAIATLRGEEGKLRCVARLWLG